MSKRVFGFIAIGIVCVAFISVFFVPVAESDRGVIKQAAYVTLSTTSGTVPIRAGESGFWGTPNRGGQIPTWRTAAGRDYTAHGGMGSTRRTLSGSSSNQDFIPLSPTTDAQTANSTPDMLTKSLITGQGVVYNVTAVAFNDTDYADWRLGGAVYNASGTLTAIGNSAVVGTAIAPTNNTAGAAFWRLTPTNQSGNFAWKLSVASRDGGVAPPGLVQFYFDEATLP